MQEPKSFTNRLIYEKSPYLLQHAHNPVDWYPWSVEAFNEAKERNVPIFLSIGYATCHWCHVMEEESFEDPEVAKVLNENFVCIKVDREELPDVDSLYMEFAQTMIVGSAGWPLNIILTPDLKPFFAATYLPKESARGLVGIIELAEKIHELWNSEEQERVFQQADKIVSILKSHVHLKGSELPTEASINQTAEILYRIADPVWGGMKGAPKFPLGYQANFLLRNYQRSQDARSLFLVEKTQEMMHRGGIYDHLGGGFHRYSVDEHWVIPHFEKMLYDNAILAYGYLETWKLTRRPVYKTVAMETLDYILRDMQHSDGGFYSAEDADTAGVEGMFYTWTRDEVKGLLGEEEGALISEFYGIYEHGMVEGRSIMHQITSVEEFCAGKSLDVQSFLETLQRVKNDLREDRKSRIRPFRDDKILTSWNGLAIHALVEAAVSIEHAPYMEAAEKAANYIKENLWVQGRLLRRLREKEARFEGNLDDYAFYIRALLSLFESGAGSHHLAFAMELANILERDFKSNDGAFYQTIADSENLLIRKTHYSDGAEPSGNAIHAENLIRLYEITQNSHYLKQAEDIFKAVMRYLETYPLGYAYHLIALQRYFDRQKAQIVIALNKKGDGEVEIKEALAKRSHPHHVVIWNKKGDAVLKELIGESAKEPLENKTTLYICHEGACQSPLTDLDAIIKSIQAL